MKSRILMSLLGLVLTLGSATAQTDKVPFNGLITDGLGTPLKRAKIYVDPKKYATSDKKGRFGLTNVQPNDTIHVVYKKRHFDIAVDGRKSLRIMIGDEINPQSIEDEKLVDLGYGYVKNREHTGVSNHITGEELVRSGYTNILQALQGRVPGLNVNTTNGVTGETSVSMRGINSFHLSTTPLYVVDNIVVNSLDGINLYDVDYVEVLKDASIYGAQGANGAILVVIKRGR
ncbi:MAG: TonB-dependent receptor plug domain-containing protein [Bacteroidales bacterium]|nr:TonB-dependent receptor plug domain-containing protein [Candidatus Minthousia equi]